MMSYAITTTLLTTDATITATNVADTRAIWAAGAVRRL
jgi:hypothetical protein